MTVKTIPIFLTSSAELHRDHDVLVYSSVNRMNLGKQGLYLEIMRVRNVLDAISDTPLQNEYNQAICNDAVFVSFGIAYVKIVAIAPTPAIGGSSFGGMLVR